MTVQTSVAGIALAAAGIAAITDMRRGKVYNWLTLPLLIVGPVAHGQLGGWPGLGASLLGAALVAALLVGLTLLIGPGLGGGDLKLLVGLGAVLGWPIAGWMLLYTAASGVIVVPVLLRRGMLKQTIQNLVLNLVHQQAGERSVRIDTGSQGPRIPYAVCILLGTLAAIFWGSPV